MPDPTQLPDAGLVGWWVRMPGTAFVCEEPSLEECIFDGRIIALLPREVGALPSFEVDFLHDGPSEVSVEAARRFLIPLQSLSLHRLQGLPQAQLLACSPTGWRRRSPRSLAEHLFHVFGGALESEVGGFVDVPAKEFDGESVRAWAARGVNAPFRGQVVAVMTDHDGERQLNIDFGDAVIPLTLEQVQRSVAHARPPTPSAFESADAPAAGAQ